MKYLLHYCFKPAVLATALISRKQQLKLNAWNFFSCALSNRKKRSAENFYLAVLTVDIKRLLKDESKMLEVRNPLYFLAKRFGAR